MSDPVVEKETSDPPPVAGSSGSSAAVMEKPASEVSPETGTEVALSGGSANNTSVALASSADTPVNDGARKQKSLDPVVKRKKAPMKKVTFDLDLEIHTIPKRVPMYEQRPASNFTANSAGGGYQYHPQAFIPRPLDLRGRDRHLLGPNSTKRIIDLFNLNRSGVGKYGPKVIGRSTKGGTSAADFLGKYPPTNSYPPNFRPPSKMSRAAFNLKQITSALGEHLTETGYDGFEWDYVTRARKQIGASSAGSTTSSIHSNSSADLSGNSKRSRGGGGGGKNPIAAFSPSRIRTSPRSAPNPQTISIDAIPTVVPGLSASPSATPSHLQNVRGNPLSLNTSGKVQLSPRGGDGGQHSKTANRRMKPSRLSGEQPFDHQRSPSSSKDSNSLRSASRCSTIETYVIGDVSSAQNPKKTDITSPRSGSAGLYRRHASVPSKKVATTVTPHQFAWTSLGAATSGASMMDTPIIMPRIGSINQQQSGGASGQPQWEVLSRPAKLSASS